MSYFEWADDMSIDNGGPIDDDHRLLVDQVNDLHSATRRGDGQAVVRSLLMSLLSSTLEHIRREEAWMESVGYPGLDEHRVGHQEFVNQLCELERKIDNGHITVAAQLSAVLRDWLSLHIRRYDRDVKVYLERKARRQAQLGRARAGRAGGVVPVARQERRHAERRRQIAARSTAPSERRHGERRHANRMQSGVALRMATSTREARRGSVAQGYRV